MDTMQTGYIYDPDEQEIDLRDMLIQIMKHWKRALVFGLVFAILLGGYRFFKAYQSYQNQLIEAKEQRENNFDLWEYEQKKAKLEETIERTDEKMDQIKEYQENSLLMNLDPYDYYWASSTYYVTTNYQIIPELGLQDKDYTDSVIAAYSQMVVDNALYDEIRSIVGLDKDGRYVSELFSFSVDYDTDMITIQAVAATEADASRIATAIKNKMFSMSDAVTSQIHEHDLELITERTEHINYDDSNRNSALSTDKDKFVYITVKELQDSYKDNYLSLNDTLLKSQQDLNDLKKDTPIVGMSISGIVKYAILGFAAGVFLICFFYAVVYIIGSSIKTEEDFTRQFGLTILGRYCTSFGGNNYFDKIIRRMEGSNEYNNTLDKALELASTNINAISDHNEEVVVVGTINSAELQTICDIMGKDLKSKIILGGNPLIDSSAVERISSASQIVLAESLHRSSRGNISKEIDILRTLKKKVLGVVLV